MGELRKRDGVWYAFWYDLKGNRHRKSTRTRNEKAARQKLREWELAHSVQRPDPFTIADALELAGQEQMRKGNVSVLDALKRAEHVARVLGETTDLHQSNLPTLGKLYLDTRRLEFIPQKKKHPEDSTILKELRVLTQGMTEGKGGDLFFGEPKLLIPKALEECGNERDRWLTQDEFAVLLEQATPYRRDWLIMYLLTGVDVGELHKVRKREDVNFKRGEFGALHICAVDEWGRKTKYRKRWVPLTAETREIVERKLLTPGPMLFSPKWTSSQVRECMLRWCPKAGIEHVIVKDLRRTFCSWMCQAGVHELHVIRLMGHGSSDMVRRVYAHLDDSSFEQAIAALPAVSDMGQAEVIPIGIHRENRQPESSEKAENA
jgi:integrase